MEKILHVAKKQLESPRVLLRDFCSEDLASVHEYSSSEEVVRWQEWGPNSEAETRFFIETCENEARTLPRLTYNLAIIDKATGQLVGGCALFIRKDGLEAEMGFSLNQKYWGQGYASEAGRVLLDFAFSERNIHRVFATCRPENLGSVAVLEKLQFQKEGCLRQNKYIRGVWHDSLIFARLRSHK